MSKLQITKLTECTTQVNLLSNDFFIVSTYSEAEPECLHCIETADGYVHEQEKMTLTEVLEYVYKKYPESALEVLRYFKPFIRG